MGCLNFDYVQCTSRVCPVHDRSCLVRRTIKHEPTALRHAKKIEHGKGLDDTADKKYATTLNKVSLSYLNSTSTSLLLSHTAVPLTVTFFTLAISLFPHNANICILEREIER